MKSINEFLEFKNKCANIINEYRKLIDLNEINLDYIFIKDIVYRYQNGVIEIDGQEYEKHDVVELIYFIYGDDNIKRAIVPTKYLESSYNMDMIRNEFISGKRFIKSTKCLLIECMSIL